MEVMVTRASLAGIVGVSLAAAIAVAACGGGSDGGGNTPTGPSSGGSGQGGQSGATITFGGSGAAPREVTISVGQTVTFTNGTNQQRNIFSDPHPVHTDCQPLNSINVLGPGQTKQTAAFTTARTCGFHDHDFPDDATLKGTIRIQ